MSKRTRIITLISALTLLTGVGAFIYYLNRVVPKPVEFTYEYGSVSLDNDVSHYIDARQKIIDEAVLDFSKVDTEKVGIYTIGLTANKKFFEFPVTIQDTTAPEIVMASQMNYGTHNQYSIDDFVSATDLSEIADITFSSVSGPGNDLNKDASVVDFDTPGEYVFTFEATDEYGNIGSKEVSIEILECPHFVLLTDKKIKNGDDLDLERLVLAYDKDGNNLTDQMIIDTDGYDFSKNGNYTFKYEVTDSDDITARGQILVEVGDFDESDYGISEDDISTLIDAGYFNYEVLESPDYTEAVSLVEPTLVCLYNSELKAKFSGYKGLCSGSGVIYSIEDDYVYFSTNEHVISSHEKWLDNIKIMFFNGEEITLDCIPERVKDDVIDIGMYKVSTKLIPLDILLRLKEITYINEQDEAMARGDELFVCSPQWNGGRKYQLSQINMREYSDLKSDEYDWIVNEHHSAPEDCFLTTTSLVHGMSGTGVFDYKGNFVGTAMANMRMGNISYDIYVDNEWLEKMYNRMN